MKRSNRSMVGIVSVILVLLGVCSMLMLNDSTAPVITLSPATNKISRSLQLTIKAVDAKSPIKNIEVIAKQNGRNTPIVQQTFSGGSNEAQVIFSLNNVEISEGSLELEVTARDDSFGGFGRGNGRKEVYSFTVDNIPPRVSIKTSTPYIRKGGSGCVLFTVSEEVLSAGIEVDSMFYPAYKQSNDDYLVFFGFPYNALVKEYKPQLVAVDTAGNITRSMLDINAMDRQFKSDTLNISQNFLDSKSLEFEAIAPGVISDVERFQRVNGPVRAACVIELLKIGKSTVPNMLWSGAFRRLPNSAARAGFADHRTYLWNGEKIDDQTHLGYDFASTAHAPIPAANDGRVIYAGYLGIYGNMVIIDHGVGLQSLYSHMSEYHVSAGQEIKKDQVIGKTGKTGMAGGDHLHFGILVSGVEVTPLEWLDPKWIKDNITGRLEAAGFKP